MTPRPPPVPSDYDENPNRMRLARSVLRRYAVTGDVHELVARRFIAEGFTRVLDVGCGEGELAPPSRGCLGRPRQLPDDARPGPDRGRTG
jgi:hypothetical protein